MDGLPPTGTLDRNQIGPFGLGADILSRIKLTGARPFDRLPTCGPVTVFRALALGSEASASLTVSSTS